MLDKALRLFSGGFRAFRQLVELGLLVGSRLQRNCAIEILQLAVGGCRVGRSSRRAPSTHTVPSTLGQQHVWAHKEDELADQHRQSVHDGSCLWMVAIRKPITGKESVKEGKSL